MSNLAWLFVAFAVVWVAIGAYLLSITTRQARIERDLQALDDSTRQD
ncbi:MAG: CcmD family protein [Actinomycetota bacterium]|nr:CcmD family protein [Actinomycetota bacterium]